MTPTETNTPKRWLTPNDLFNEYGFSTSNVTIQPFPQQTKVIFHETRVPTLKRKRHHVYDK